MLNIFRSASFLLFTLLLGLGLVNCSGSDGGGKTITVYSGRSENLIAPMLALWENATGNKVNVKYGGSTDLALLINEEGRNSPADVFISQSPGAAGFLASKNLLAQISSSLQQKVVSNYRSSDSTWVGLTGRQRVLVYNPTLVDQADLPNTIDELTQPKYNGKVGVAPGNGSFQDFVTAMRFERGDTATESWLRGMATNNSPNYPKNSAIVSAVIAGEIEMGLVNHYYLLRTLAEDPNANGVNHYLDANDIGSLLIITTGSILKSSNNKKTAEELLDYLLEPTAQNYFVNNTREYPLIPNAQAPEGVPNLNAFSSPQLNDFNRLGTELTGTIQLIENSGLVQG